MLAIADETVRPLRTGAARRPGAVPAAQPNPVMQRTASTPRNHHESWPGPGFHVHQLRHTLGCRYLERGGTLHVLQELMGHSSVVTTQRCARLSEDAIRAEAARLSGQTVGKRSQTAFLPTS